VRVVQVALATALLGALVGGCAPTLQEAREAGHGDGGARAAESTPGRAVYLARAADEAMQVGLVAGELGEWELAVEYLQRAQRLAPRHPQVLYNLGVASAGAGHDLLALLWLGAARAADPSGSNAAAIRTGQANASERFATGLSFLTHVADGIRLDRKAMSPTPVGDVNHERLMVLYTVGESVDDARRAVAYWEEPARWRALTRIATTQALVGDPDGAGATVRMIEPPELRAAAAVAVATARRHVFEADPALEALAEVDWWVGLAEKAQADGFAADTRVLVNAVLDEGEVQPDPVAAYEMLLDAAEAFAEKLLAAVRIELYWEVKRGGRS
jgi:hypothetical protein